MSTTYDYQAIAKQRDNKVTWEKIGEAYGTAPERVRGAYRRWLDRSAREAKVGSGCDAGFTPVIGRLEMKENREKGTAVSLVYVKDRPKNIEEHMAQFGIDTDVWEAVTVDTNNWQGFAKTGVKGDECLQKVDLYQIKVKWRARPGVRTSREIIDKIIEGKRPRFPKFNIKKVSAQPGLLALNIPDLHLGKLAWEPETGSSYDSATACEMFTDAFMDLGTQASKEKIGNVLFTVGNDFLNVDQTVGGAGQGGATTRGTVQDEDSRWQKSFERGVFLLINRLEDLLKMFPKTNIHVKVVPGNHDTQRIYYVGVALMVHFANHPRVHVDNSPSTRKFFDGNQWGCPVALMMLHGDKEKPNSYPALMASRFDLRQYKAREVYVGHLHHQRGQSFDTYTEIGQLIARWFPSLSAPDAWHAAQGYMLSQRAAQGLIYRPDGHLGKILHHYPE